MLPDVYEAWLWATRRSLSPSRRMPSSSSRNRSASRDLWAALHQRIAASEEENERLLEYIRKLREAHASLWNVQELQAQAYDHELAVLRGRVAELSAKLATAPPTGAPFTARG